MTGHEPLLTMRFAGYKPKTVYLVLVEERAEYGTFTHPNMAIELGGAPTIVIDPEDIPQALDLRCLRGLIVQIAGLNEARTVETLKRVVEFEPLKAIAGGGDFDLYAWKPNKGFYTL